MSGNPYTLTFGKEPAQIISRIARLTEVVDIFSDENPSSQIYMITGIRGIGKTVFMTDIAKTLAQRDEWIVRELNPNRDMLLELASKLSGETALAQIFKKARINLSFFGFGVEIDGISPITDIEDALDKMLKALKKKGKKVLITIDEVVNCKEIQDFSRAFQIMLRADLPVYLLMTGLYENINELQNEKNLTFLYRAPKITLGPLNIGSIAENYKKTFLIDGDNALKMARVTMGYSFAFQVLGYFTWDNNGDYEDILPKYKQYLEEYVYDKVWSELSNGDKKILFGIASTKDGKISDVRKNLGIDNNQINPYRKRLIQKGIINGDERGYVKLVLPMFKQYILENYGQELEEL